MIRIVDIYKEIEPDNDDAIGLFNIEDYDKKNHCVDEQMTAVTIDNLIELRDKLIKMDLEKLKHEQWQIKNGYNKKKGKRP